MIFIALDVKEPNLIVDTIPSINSIYVYQVRIDSFLYFTAIKEKTYSYIPMNLLNCS